jgi:hypothetical protein
MNCLEPETPLEQSAERAGTDGTVCSYDWRLFHHSTSSLWTRSLDPSMKVHRLWHVMKSCRENRVSELVQVSEKAASANKQIWAAVLAELLPPRLLCLHVLGGLFDRPFGRDFVNNKHSLKRPRR